MVQTQEVAILGSCVTRDAFEAFPNSGLKISDYTARTSLASLAASPHRDQAILDAISSKFQRRMVERDMLKSFWSSLERGEAKTLVLDLIDDRFDLAMFSGGGANTLSSEYRKVRKAALQPFVDLIPSHTSRYIDLWERGCDRLLQEVKARGIRLILNEVYHLPTGVESIDGESKIEEANSYLISRYKYIGDVDKISYEENEIEVDHAHKWGVANFHYSEATYKRFMEKLTALLSGAS